MLLCEGAAAGEWGRGGKTLLGHTDSFRFLVRELAARSTELINGALMGRFFSKLKWVDVCVAAERNPLSSSRATN